MTDNMESLVLEHLRHIRSKVDQLVEDNHDLKNRMSSLESAMVSVKREVAHGDERNPRQGEKRSEHAQNHQGDGDGRGVENAPRTAADARGASVCRQNARDCSAFKPCKPRISTSVYGSASGCKTRGSNSGDNR